MPSQQLTGLPPHWKPTFFHDSTALQGTWAYIRVDTQKTEAFDMDKRDYLIMKEQVIGMPGSVPSSPDGLLPCHAVLTLCGVQSADCQVDLHGLRPCCQCSDRTVPPQSWPEKLAGQRDCLRPAATWCQTRVQAAHGLADMAMFP